MYSILLSLAIRIFHVQFLQNFLILYQILHKHQVIYTFVKGLCIEIYSHIFKKIYLAINAAETRWKTQ